MRAARKGHGMDHFGIAIPQDLTMLRNLQLRSFLESAEELGYSGLWVSESNASEVLDPLGVLNYAAAVTRTPLLGAAVLLTARRAPMQLARDLATIDQLSDGRLIVGVGLGKDGSTYGQFGLSLVNRVERYAAGVELMQRLWAESRITFDSPWWQLEGVERPLTTVQQPNPPVWFGARKPAALRRAATLGNGWVGAGSASPAEFEESLRDLRPLVAEIQGADADFAIAKRVYVHVGPVTPSVQTEIEQWFSHHYGDASLAARVAIVGDAGHCIEHLRWLQGLGVANVILHPIIQPTAQMERLAREVIPALRA